MLPVGQIAQMVQNAIQCALKNRTFQMMVLRVLASPEGQRQIKNGGSYILETISEFATSCKIRLSDGEIEAETVVHIVQKTYNVGDVSNSTVIQGEHIVNNTSIHISIQVQNYQELKNMLSEIPDIRRKLESNMQDYSMLKLFANTTLNPFLGKLERILSESTEYDKLKLALRSEE